MIYSKNILSKVTIFLILIYSLVSGGNTGKITGTVTDASTGELLIGVNIQVLATDLGAATDTEGKYFILFVPPGTYEIKTTAIGKAASTIKDVKVVADLSTKVNFKMKTEAIAGEEVVVSAEKPLVETDLVSSRKTVSAEMFENMPIEDIEDILNLTAGFVDGHARGGRDGEILYLINGVPAVDPMNNSFDTSVPEFSIAEADIITSGISVEYSNALSGVVNMVIKEGGPEFGGKIRFKTDNSDLVGLGDGGLHQSQGIEGSFGGPVFGLPLRWFLAGEFSNTNGRYGISQMEEFSIAGNFIFRPFPKSKIQLSLNHYRTTYNDFEHEYSRTTYENEDADNDGRLDRIITLTSKDLMDPSLYNSGGLFFPIASETGFTMEEIFLASGLEMIMDGDFVDQKRNVMIEVDIDEKGTLLSGDGDFRNEDLNGNGVWDLFDLNRSGGLTDSSFVDFNGDELFQWGIDIPIPNTPSPDSLGHQIIQANRNLSASNSDLGFNDSFSMLDHLLRNKEESTHLSLSINQQISDKTFIQFVLSRYETYLLYNTNESADIPAYYDYLTSAGIPEDMIENYSGDLLTDWNNNDFLDISEDAFPDNPSQWLTWETVPIQNTQDIDKFYTYGTGTTFYRLRWNEDKKTIWNFKSILTSQATTRHLLKAGFEMNLYNVFDHDVDMPSGGNIYGQDIGTYEGWGHGFEDFFDYGYDGVENTDDFGEGDGTWTHEDWGADSQWAVDGNGDGDFDDQYIDIQPDAGEGDGIVNYNEPHEDWIDLYPDGAWNPSQSGLTPLWWGVFLEDKMEFEGIVIVGGIRLDYFNPRFDNFPSDIFDPVIDQTLGGQVKDPTSVSSKWYWSPRIGIAYPITDKSAFYFNYGRTFQIPQFRYMYRNINWDFSGAFPIIGNPNILPETTTSYELGLRRQIGANYRLEVKGFYKDIQGLVDTRQTWIQANQYYTMHINGDYGNVRGFEVDLYKRFGKYFGGDINYTFSIAKGKSSSSLQNYRFTWASLVIPKEENYLDWDQRHTINTSLMTKIPVVNVNWNTTFQYGSGLPYSPPNRSLLAEINTKRLPGTFIVNVFADKRFSLPSALGKDVSIAIFLWVDNLLDTKNIQNTSLGFDEEWYDLYAEYQNQYDAGNTVFYGSEIGSNGIDDDGDGYIDETLHDEYMMIMDTDGDGQIDSNKQNPAGGQMGNPTYYSEGRRIKMGLSISF